MKKKKKKEKKAKSDQNVSFALVFFTGSMKCTD